MTILSASMGPATINLISVARAQAANPPPCIVASSALIPRSTAVTVSSRNTENFHCIVWRYVHRTSVILLHSHRPQSWQNGFFNRTSLHSLGFTCHLGHRGDPCPIQSPPHTITIVDANGWHKVKVTFCACDISTPWRDRYRQLLRMRWYPASFKRPRSAFTFDLLETYHKLTLQAKVNLYDFYHSIMQKSDNEGRSKPMVSDM